MNTFRLEWRGDTLFANLGDSTVELGSVEEAPRSPRCRCRSKTYRWTNTAPTIAGGNRIRGHRSTLADARASLEKSIRTCCLHHRLDDALDRLETAPDPRAIRTIATFERIVRGLRTERAERLYARLSEVAP